MAFMMFIPIILNVDLTLMGITHYAFSVTILYFLTTRNLIHAGICRSPHWILTNQMSLSTQILFRIILISMIRKEILRIFQLLDWMGRHITRAMRNTLMLAMPLQAFILLELQQRMVFYM